MKKITIYKCSHCGENFREENEHDEKLCREESEREDALQEFLLNVSGDPDGEGFVVTEVDESQLETTEMYEITPNADAKTPDEVTDIILSESVRGDVKTTLQRIKTIKPGEGKVRMHVKFTIEGSELGLEVLLSKDVLLNTLHWDLTGKNFEGTPNQDHVGDCEISNVHIKEEVRFNES